MSFNRTILSKAPFSYALAIGLSGIAFLLTRLLVPRLPNAPFDLFQGAVVICAIYGGLGPALVTTVLSIAALDYFFLPPYNNFSLAAADVLQLLTFGAVALVTSSLSVRLKKATSDLKQEVTQRLDVEKEILQISGREQRRLGEDLHDGVCQTLAGVRLLSKELKDRIREAGRSEWNEIQEIESRLGEALAQADVAARGLYPVDFESNGLMAALDDLCKKISTIHRVHCEFHCASPILIEDSATATHLYRITQEAIANAIKRGKAKRISIRLTHLNGQAVLSVTDNGIGLKAVKPRNGMGIKIMSYRARMINATLALRSRARGCTRVICRFHLDRLKGSYA